MARLTIRVLGAFEAHRMPGDEPIVLHSRKLRGLLAYLALCPGLGQPRETLAALLWDRSAEEQARASLRQALAVLRKAIDVPGPPVLVADHHRIALAAEAVWVDAVEFQRLVTEGSPEALQRATTLYRGRLVEGLSVESEAFEEWARAEGQRLQDLAMGALTKLLAHEQERGALDAAARIAHRILAIDPLHDEAHRALIGLYVRQGARGEALRQYERYRSLLQRELGLEPDAETRRLAQQLDSVQQTPVPGAVPAAAPAVDDVQTVTSLTARAAAQGVLATDFARQDILPSPYRTGRFFVTLMSCSLADAAAMSTWLDPEDLRDLFARFEAGCAEPVEREGGRVLQRSDHLVTACFGHPRADEHAAERAVRAALAIVAATGRLPGPRQQALRASVSIASGEMVVGSRGATDGVMQDAITGETTHVVAALQRMAPPDGVLIADSTRALLGALFDCEDLGWQSCEGFKQPVRAWRVLRERTGQSRFAATRAAKTLAPLIGRDEEIELLLRRWQRARSGAGQVVVLAGEPGIGKSRLVEALRQALAGEAHTYLGYYCSPHHQESSLYPVIQQLERAAGYARDDPPQVKLDKLEALLCGAARDMPVEAALIADLLSIPTGDRYAARNLTPQRQKEKTLEVLDEQLVGLTRRQPALMVFEDVHWIDPTSREVLERLADLVQGLPVLMIVTQRPGTSFARSDEPHVTSLVVKRLGRRESEALVEELAGDRSLPKDVLARIVDRGDGVPLFLEALAKDALEARGRDGGGEGDGPGRRVADVHGVPRALHELLAARLDRLGPARVAAQEAAVIGRRFSYALLAAVSTLKEPELRAALERLVDADLAYAHGAPPHGSYSFKHALIQDAAYASLTRADRWPLHERIATALEERFPETRDAEPELLAHHFSSAGLEDRAIPYWQKAGELAARRWAYREAIAYFEQALASLRLLPPTVAGSGQELALQVLVSQAWMITAGYTAPQTQAALERARELCEEIGDAYQLFFVLLGLWQLHIAREQLPLASDFAERLLSLALQQDNRDLAIEAHVAKLVTAFMVGDFEKTLAHANEAIALGALKKDEAHILSAGYDGRVLGQSGAAWALWALGLPEQALERSEEALATARRLAHPYSLAMALYVCPWVHVYRREATAARELASGGMALANEHGFVWTEAFAGVLHGWALAEEGRAAVGIEQIQSSLAILEQMGHTMWRPHQQGLLAGALARAGRTDEALAVIAEALESVNATGETEHAAELHRQKGELTLQRGRIGAKAEAERCFRRAIEIARGQKAKSWELRATVSLARLWRDQGKRRQARDLLAPVYAWFTEGFDTPDLKEARALLDELAEGAGHSAASASAG